MTLDRTTAILTVTFLGMAYWIVALSIELNLRVPDLVTTQPPAVVIQASDDTLGVVFTDAGPVLID